MGTTYNELREPWSSIRVQETEKHTRITLWENGALAGTLTVRSEVAHDVIYSLTGHEVGKHWWGGDERGRQYTHYRDPRSKQVISEYADIFDHASLVGADAISR